MIGNKGYEGKNFKDSLRYEMPKITMADLADEFLENLKAREKKKIEKNIGKEPGELPARIPMLLAGVAGVFVWAPGWRRSARAPGSAAGVGAGDRGGRSADPDLHRQLRQERPARICPRRS